MQEGHGDADADAHRCCALCGAGAAAALGPYMPVQIRNGRLKWVHRDCALWSPEVAVDGAGRLVSRRAAAPLLRSLRPRVRAGWMRRDLCGGRPNTERRASL
jgi:hypothetical protein